MSFSEEKKIAVWKKASEVEGFDMNKYRKDPCGAWMIFDEYGNKNSIYGWEINHIYPQFLLEEKNIDPAKIDDIANLRAMQWENDESKGDDYPTYQSAISSEDNKNISMQKSLTVNEKIQETLQQLYQLKTLQPYINYE